jgi:hypothetical protein
MYYTHNNTWEKDCVRRKETRMDRAEDEVAVVLAWHAALNGGDADRLVALSHDDVEMGGPRGAAYGVGTLREWVDRAGIVLEPGRLFRRGGTVVVEERAAWRPAAGETPGEPTAVASVFAVEEGRVRRVVRHDGLAAALAAAGLAEEDEIARPG